MGSLIQPSIGMALSVFERKTCQMVTHNQEMSTGPTIPSWKK